MPEIYDAANSIQPLLWPEQGVVNEQELFFRLSSAAGFDDRTNEIRFETGGSAKFDTSFNLFNLGKWQRCCGLDNISLTLRGSGTFEVVVFQSLNGASHHRIANRILAISDETRIDLGHFVRSANSGILYFSLLALGPGRLTGGGWTTMQAPLREPQLALSITTFRREEAERSTVRRFEHFMKSSPLAPHLQMIIVDNGNTLGELASPGVTVVPNKNLGGSGGFARGLMEAEARGATHCVFMDDDASITMPALERVWLFLAYATDLSVAVAGALTQANRVWQLWENGASFDRYCRPHWSGIDLRDFHQCLEMEVRTAYRAAANFYGGWWFFAFAIKSARYHPFPFFVRGDDISFSIANGFDISNLPGVVCFQDSDFSEKESLQTLYLDLRNHLVHHLSLPMLDRGMGGTVWIAAMFFVRSLLQCHYETLDAIILATEDVMRGPDFFAANADMAERRSRLSGFRKAEAWKPLTEAPPSERWRINPHGNKLGARFWRTLLNLSLNGLLLPFFGYWGNSVTLRAGQRGHLPAVWGAARITYVSSDGTQFFTVRHSKIAAMGRIIKMLALSIRFALRYGSLKREWQEAYPRLTSRAFWEEKFRE